MSEQGKVIDFGIEKLRQEGTITPEVLHDTFGKWLESDTKIEQMAIVYKYQDPDDEESSLVGVAYTNSSLQSLLGLFEWAKAVLIEEAKMANEEE